MFDFIAIIFLRKSLKILFTNQAVYDILKKVRLIFSQEDIILDNNQLQKRYGLFTAICMVVGIVIGSGVFFKAQDILNYTGGDMLLGILAWIIGGVVMIICAFNFANFATRYLKVNGIVDYAEAIVGERYAYMTGWFLSTIYFPAMTSVLAWVSARYTLILFNPEADITSGLCMSLGAFYLCMVYALNVLAPKIAGKFEVSATVIKLIPLAIIVVVGTIVGLVNGNTVEAFTQSAQSGGGDFSSVFAGIAAAAFAYEGWIIATSINAELKNAKRNLPIALVLGTLIIMVIYVTYFIGLTGGATVDVLREQGAPAALKNLFGSVGGTVLNAFIVISCLGTLNGLMIACTRSLYSIAVRGHGPKPEVFSSVDPKTNMPTNSGIFGLMFCAIWFFYFYGANLTAPIFGIFSFDSSELPIITIYGIYIPIFIKFIAKEIKTVKEDKKGIFKNIVMPVLATLAAAFMVFVAVYAHGIRPWQQAAENGTFTFPVLFYLIVFIVIMAIGAIFYKKKEK
ncbi:MAG: amino acid permease [Clostridia bacterium]|nr:amino acid permease [Clostridia bacterium]